MSDDAKPDRLADEYLDGSLSPEQTRELAALLEKARDQRKYLALSAVIQRLLKASKLPPIPSQDVLNALPQTKPDQEEIQTRTPRKKIRKPKEQPGKQIRKTRRTSWNQARSTHRPGSRVAVAVVGVLFATLGFWAWHHIHSMSTPHQLNNSTPNAPVPQTPSIQHPTSSNEHPPTTQQPNNSTTHPNPHQTKRSIISTLPPIPPPLAKPLPLPRGDGSTEPGFVSPPAGWQSTDAGQGARTDPHPMTEAKRGPHAPVLFIKLKAGDPVQWNVTPNDLSALLKEMKKQINVDYSMETRSLSDVDPDPERNPILYRTGHYHFILTRQERIKLRRFMLSGGMVIFNTGLGSKPFYDSARRELRTIFPEIPLQRLSLDHPIYQAYHNIRSVHYHAGIRNSGYKDHDPWLEGITLNCRTAAVISRWGMAVGWEGKDQASQPAIQSQDALHLGINLCSYAIAQRAWEKQAASTTRFVETGLQAPGTLNMVQVMYGGEWQTRLAGLSMLLHTFNQKTDIPVRLGVKQMKLTDSGIFDAPLLYITGHERFELTPAETAQLRKYLNSGGFLFAEACCGRKSFDTAFRNAMKRVLPGTGLKQIPGSSPVFRFPNIVTTTSVTPSLAAQLGSSVIHPRLEGIDLEGTYAVIYSPYGLAGGWEGSPNPYANGYNSAEAMKLGQNILMYAVTH